MSEEETTLTEFKNDEVDERDQQDSTRRLPEIDSIPDDWELSTVETVAEQILGGGTPSKSNSDYWGGDVPWASVKDLGEIELSDSEDSITESGVNNSATNVIPASSVIVSTRMTVGEPFLNTVDMAINQDMKGILPNTEVINPLFLVYSLWDKDPYLKSLGRGTTVDGITTNDLSRTHIGLPSLREQRKIASVLYTVDQAIQKTEDVINQTRRIKNGLLQDLFTDGFYGHSEFKDTKIGQLPESWELGKLKDYVKLISGAHVQSDLVSHNDSLTPYLTGPEDFDEFGFTVTKYTDEPTNFCEPEDTLVTVKGSGCGKATYANERACISRQLKALRPNDGLDSLYLFYFVKTKQNYLETLAEGSAIPGLSNSHLTTLDVPIPDLEEQREIAGTLRDLDHRIVHEQEYRNQLQRLKQGLMQDLLSGKVRTHDKDIEIIDDVLKHG